MKPIRAAIVLMVVGITASFVALPAGATHGVDAEVTIGSNDGVFPQNKQNEPAIAVDPNHPNLLVAGANEEIDVEGCNVGADTSCPFTPGVGTTGIYFSFNSGDSWQQPTYTGYSTRNCLGTPGPDDTCTPDEAGPIGTLPWYFENGVVSDGDPALAFGPTPDSNGDFSWSNGSRLYVANLTGQFSSKRSEFGFKGVEAIGVSRTDIPPGGISSLPAKGAWMDPVLIPASGSGAGFADKEQVWADNAESSPFFGNAYVCFGNFVGGPSAGSNAVREVLARSTDGGDTWTKRVVHKNTSSSSGALSLISGTSGCTVRTGSDGTVYLFWLGFNGQTKVQGIYLTRSFDGGATFETARRVFVVHNTGAFDPAQGRNTVDGVAGARADLGPAPSVDVANNSPVGEDTGTVGDDATDQIVMSWVDGADGLNNEHVKFSTSTNGGTTWTTPRNIEVAGDRGFYTAPAISPDGSDVYVIYNAFLEDFQTTTSAPRHLIGVFLHADVSGGVVGSFAEAFSTRATAGDARSSSANVLSSEFLGDYVYAVARDTYGAAVWNDSRDGADCEAIDDWRQSILDKNKKNDLPTPAPNVDCTPSGGKVFGNSSIYGVSIADPT